MVDEALLSNAGSDERESSELKKVSPLPPTPDVSAAPNKEDRQKPPSIKTLILEPHGTHEGTDRLVGGGIIPEEQQLIDYNMADAPFRQGHMARSTLLDSPSTFKILRGGENDHAKSDRGNPAVQPDMVIVAIPDESTLSHYRDTLRQLADEMWHDFPESDRPMVVLSCNGFDPPGYLKQLYQGFRFVRDTDELKRLTQQNTDMVALRQRGEDHRPGGLVVKQEQQYDASEDLRLWEQKTANTYESLRHIYDRSRQRNAALERYGMGVNGAPLRKEMSVLDLGTGEGRIGGMIARTGGNVVGMDIRQWGGSKGLLALF